MRHLARHRDADDAEPGTHAFRGAGQRRLPPDQDGRVPGTHGATVAGMHGAGVGTPRAAAVAAITVGLVSAVHMPNGMMFVIGTKSMMFPDC